jgi:DNA polymerase III subunit epsilon
MRQIFLDTETTGLEHKLGHRIIEIGGVEMRNRRLTNRHFHRYLNPDRDIDEGALAVHGISLDFLQDKPRFADIAAEFIDFVRGAELIIHNAPFDIGFLNAELARLDMAPIDTVCHGVLDTLRMAKDLHPGKKNNLNVLCERYGVDNSRRTLHGALLDAEILAEVYVAMTRGQESLIIDLENNSAEQQAVDQQALADRPRRAQRIVRASDDEIAEHQALLAAIQKESKGQCLWLADETAAQP